MNILMEKMSVLGMNTIPFFTKDLKSYFYKLIKVHHPDVGGSHENAANIISAYKDLLPYAKDFEKLTHFGGPVNFESVDHLFNKNKKKYYWIHSNEYGINKRVKFEDLDTFIKAGWKRGMLKRKR